MNKEECELCIKYKTMYCPNSSECYMTQDKPYYQNRIMLLEENKKLQQKVNQLETNRDELKKWLEEEKNKHYDRKWLSDDELCYRLEDNSAKTIIAVQAKIDELERGKE